MRLALAVVLCTSPAFAADVVPTVQAHLTGTSAQFELVWHFDVPKPMWTDTFAELAIPTDAVVTSATVDADGHTRELALQPADGVRAAFDDLVARPATRDRASSIILVADNGRIDVGVAVPHTMSFDLRVQVRAPTCFEGDVRYVAVPYDWKVPSITAPLHCGDAMKWMRFSTREVARLSGDRIGVVADGLQLDDHQIGRAELDLASTLADVPADLATVLVVDHSRSLDFREQAAIQRVIDAYLDAAPASRVQLVTFARTATTQLAGWTVARDAKGKITAALAQAALHNGSNLDVALDRAASLLAGVRGTHRVIVLTDARLAARIQTDQLRAGDALIHVVDIDPTRELARDDTAPLADVARATGGIAVVAGRGDPTTDKLDATMLARPISFDHVSVSAPGWQPVPALEVTCNGDLHEGGSCMWWGRSSMPGPVTLSGDVWGKRVSRVVQPDVSRGRDVARELAGSPAFDDDPDADDVARAAFAIDRAWSMSVTWGGSGGYADLPVTFDGRDGSGCGCGDPAGRGLFGIGGYGRVVQQRSIAEQLAHSVAACKIGDARVELALELTREEIADVLEARIVPADGPTITSGALYACVVDAVWDTDLVIQTPDDHVTRRYVIVGE